VPPPLKLVLVIPSLSGGGAERVAQLLSGGLVRAGHEVTVVTTTSRPDFYALAPGSRRVRTDVTSQPPGNAVSFRAALGTIARVPKGLLELRRAILSAEPDVVIAFMEHANVLTLALVGSRVPVVATEHSDPAQTPLGLGWRALRRLTYRRARLIVSVSQGVDAWFDWLPKARRRVIHNPVDTSHDVTGTTPVSGNGPYIAAMGRLTTQKGFDLLLAAFAIAAPARPSWRLVIIGDGPDAEKLLQQSRRLGIEDRVEFLGTLSQPFETLRGSELFVLSSRWEGFGNVLAEALSCGVPVVSFDCPSGPAEIVRPDTNGVLVPPQDTEGLAQAIGRLMGDPIRRRRLADAAPASVVHLSLKQIVAQWEAELHSVVGSSVATSQQERADR